MHLLLIFSIIIEKLVDSFRAFVLAWLQNEKQHSLIDYSYAFDLRQL